MCKKCEPEDKVEVCLVVKFLADQQLLPPWKRSNAVMISCNCSACSKVKM